MQTIHDLPDTTALPRVAFDWSPKSTALTITLGGNTYPWTINQPASGAPDQPDVLYTNIGQELTFTATVELDDDDAILEYYWDFGDGTNGYGPSVLHTYRTDSPQLRVHLKVTDNHQRKVYSGRQVNLKPAIGIGVGMPQPLAP